MRTGRDQSGAATLALVTLLLFGMALLALHGARAKVLEHRLAGSETRAVALHAAAQSGLESALEAAVSLLQAGTMAFDDSGWIDVDGPRANLAGGTRFETRLTNRGLVPFDLRLIEIDSRGVGDDGSARAARQQAVLRPWLARVPEAALIVAGDALLPGAVALQSGPGGVLVWSGGILVTPATQDAPPGSPCPDGICDDDARLASLPAGRLLAGFLGRSPAMLERLAATGPAGAQVIRLHDATGTVTLATASYGTAETPALVVVDGDLEITGEVSVLGVLCVAGDWLPASGRVEVTGAMIVAGRALHAGSVGIDHDADTLSRLAASGPYARIAGTWEDF